MNDDEDVKILSSGLRQRRPALPPSQSPSPTSAPTNSDASFDFDETAVDWEGEIKLAREAVARRMLQQQVDDGYINEDEDEEEQEGEEKQGTSANTTISNGAEQPGVLERDQQQEQDQQQQQEQEQQAEVPISAATETAADGEDEKTCRICFGGSDDELGRLFSPCLCRGTARYVHTACLDRWRATSVGRSSSYECDQCRYKYLIRRTTVSGLAENKVALTSLTVVLLTVLLYLSGFVTTWITDAVDRSSFSSSFGSEHGGFMEEFYISDSMLIKEAVSGAWSLLDQIIGGSADTLEFARSPAGTDGRTYSKVNAKEENDEDAVEVEPDIQRDPEAWDRWNERSSRYTKRDDGKSDGGSRNDVKKSWIRSFIEQIAKGASFVGILSGFQSLFSFSLFGLRGTIFRAIRTPRRGRDRRQQGGDGGINFVQLALVTMVVVGVIKAATQVYRLVKWIARRTLARIEGLVMDVN